MRVHKGKLLNLLVCEAQAQGQFDTLKEASTKGVQAEDHIIRLRVFVLVRCVLQEGCAGDCFALINAQTRDGGYA